MKKKKTEAIIFICIFGDIPGKENASYKYVLQKCEGC